MNASLECIYCIMKKADENYSLHESDPEKKLRFMKNVLRVFAESKTDTSAPYLTKCINDLMYADFGRVDDYDVFKKAFNSIMLRKEPDIAKRISESGDPLLTALRYAMAGNLIDAHSVEELSEKKLDALFARAETQNVNTAQYETLLKDLEKARSLAYLHDNAGEIVADKLLIRQLRTLYPALRITSIVRGKPVINDATPADAEETGLSDLVTVLGNGTDIPGTELGRISDEAREAITKADLIFSKGQANFETLHGCGLNIYYLFLCKCNHFVNRFGLERFTGVFLNENAVKDFLPRAANA